MQAGADRSRTYSSGPGQIETGDYLASYHVILDGNVDHGPGHGQGTFEDRIPSG